jgi:hypothetical protein
LSIIIKFIPIDVFIQRILDNISKGNKIAGTDDLVNKNEKEISDDKTKSNENNVKNDEKGELNNSINSKGSKNTKPDNSKDDPNGSIMKALRRNSNVSSGGGSLRQTKPNIIVSYD